MYLQVEYLSLNLTLLFPRIAKKDSVGVPKATQLFAINEKWLLVKCKRRFFSFCV